MDLRVLKYFLTVAREENITKAAALLHLTQPTLSRQLMQLEEELGGKLFQRSRHRIVLTDDGMLLRRRAQELVDLADKTVQEFRKEPELRGVISIGSGDLEGMHLLAGWLAPFQALHPQVTYQLYSGNADNTRERIEGGMLDLALLLEPVDSGHQQIRFHPSAGEGAVGGTCAGGFASGAEGMRHRAGSFSSSSDLHPP